MNKPGRNDLCPCGSGKKYKQCCLLSAPDAAAPEPIAAVLQAALVHHQSGRLAEAEALYQQILQREPAHADALHLLGALAFQVGKHGIAIDLISRAIAAYPDNANYYFNLANAQKESGAADAAIANYRQALVRNPNFYAAYVNLGSALQEQGDLEAAINNYLRARTLRADVPELFNNLGNALQARGQLDDAIANYRQALELKPEFAEAHNNLGNALKSRGEFDAAMMHFKQAIALKPDYAEVHFNLGNVWEAKYEMHAALACYQHALLLNANFYSAYNNAGHVLKELGQLKMAIEYLHHAIALKPNEIEAHNNLGNALKADGQAGAAVDCYRRAIELNPELALTYYNLGNTLQDLGAFDAAVEHYRHAIKIQPDYVEALNNLGTALSSQGKADEALDYLHRALALQPDFEFARSALLFHLNYESDCSPEHYLDEARVSGQAMTAKARPYTHWPLALARQPGQALKVGLVSGDLRGHPVGYFLESVLAHLDPARIELTAYVTRAQEDALTARIKPRFASWQSLLGLSDEAAARKIHADGIHVLIDLAGHTLHNRLSVFAWRPAPVQLAWLGYFASTGLKEMDYILADRWVLPPEEESHFVERPWRMPDCYLCFTPPQDQIAVGPLPLLSSGHVTFGCFNRLSKLNDAVLALWSRVLQAVPDSRLLLKAKELLEPSAQQATVARFAAHGIDPGRILVEGFTPRADYLANYQRVDIALDPFPFPGGTTTVEALWMGVPVLTRRGNRFLSHAGESLLHTAGLDSWIADDDDDYVAKAQAYAHDRVGLAACRAGLRQQLVASPLCDATRFAGHLDAALHDMWQQALNHE